MRTISVNQTTEIYTMQCNRMINILTGFEAAYNMRTHTHTHMHNKNTTIDNERCLKLYKSYHLLQFHSGWRLYFANFIGSFMHYLRCRAFRSIHTFRQHIIGWSFVVPSAHAFVSIIISITCYIYFGISWIFSILEYCVAEKLTFILKFLLLLLIPWAIVLLLFVDTLFTSTTISVQGDTYNNERKFKAKI